MPTIRQALVPASQLTSVLDGSLLGVDVRPLLLHVLHGLQDAGIERVIVVLGVGVEKLVELVQAESFPRMIVKFIWGVEFNWGSTYANNVMTARSAFEGDEPLLIVRADYLFDWRLLHKMARCAFTSTVDAFALIDSAPETLEWVTGAHCKAYCKGGHCNALVKVQRGMGDCIERIGHRLDAYDALQVGIYVCRPVIFAEMSKLLVEHKFCTVSDAMQSLASVGRLRHIDVDELVCNKHWFGHEVMQSALMEHSPGSSTSADAALRTTDSAPPEVSSQAAAMTAMQPAIRAALALLFGRSDSYSRSPVQRSAVADASAVPMYTLGIELGSGSTGVVHQATKPSQSPQSSIKTHRQPSEELAADLALPAGSSAAGSGAPGSSLSAPCRLRASRSKTSSATLSSGSSCSSGSSGELPTISGVISGVSGRLGGLGEQGGLPPRTSLSPTPEAPPRGGLGAWGGGLSVNCGGGGAGGASSDVGGTFMRHSSGGSFACPPGGFGQRAATFLPPASSSAGGGATSEAQAATSGGMPDGYEPSSDTGHLAVKVVRKGQVRAQTALWEVHVLRCLKGHRHIVKLIDVVDVVDTCYMIMERVTGPDLSRHISEQPGAVLVERHAQKIFCQLLDALRHAHAVGFVHCDVKPANVRLHPRLEYHSLHAVLLDWGYARRIGDQSEPITQGSPAYAAPEQLTGYSTDGVCARASLRPAVDVWSLGATLCEMLSGAPPFGGRDFERLKANVLGLHFVASACTIRPGSAARDLMDAMLQIHPTDRASLPDCCVHAWVQGCGELPPPSDILLGLQCDDCEGPENTSTRGLTKLKSATGLMRWLPGGLGTGAPASRTLGLAIYIVLCGAALLWTQSGPAVGNSGVQFVLAEEG